VCLYIYIYTHTHTQTHTELMFGFEFFSIILLSWEQNLFMQDDTSSIHWRNWTFMENTTSMNYGQESVNSSVLEGSIESLSFDKVHSSLNPSGVSISQNALSSDRLSIIPKKLEEVLPSSPASLAEQTACLTRETAELVYHFFHIFS